MTYKVRRVEPFEDPVAEEDITELHRQTFGKGAPFVNLMIGQWWLVYLKDEPVAFAGLHPSSQFFDCGYLVRAGVREDHRGHGLQLKLIRARERVARTLKYRALFCDCTDNLASANTLIKAGYKLYQPEVPWAFKNTLYWRKVLQEKHG